MRSQANHLRVRLWAVSALVGCVISGTLTTFVWMTRSIFFFPPAWPGLFLAWGVVAVGYEPRGHFAASAVITIGNAGVYALLFFVVIRAEVLSRGPLGRWFLRWLAEYPNGIDEGILIAVQGSNRTARLEIVRACARFY